MEAFSEQKLNSIVSLYCLLDAIRAKKFVNPENLENAIQLADSISILQDKFPDWKMVLSKLKEGFSTRISTIEFVISLQKVELYPLFLYLLVTGVAMITANSTLWQLQATIAVIVFIFLAGVRIATYIFVNRPVAEVFTHLQTIIPDLDQKLFEVISALVYRVDQQLLLNERSPSLFKHYLEHMDYPGVYYHGRRTFLGPRRIPSIPYPLHIVLSEATGRVKVIMARLDEKLIMGLSQVPQDTEIQLVTMTTIARQTTFMFGITNLYKAHANLKVTLLPPQPDVKGVYILTHDEVWQFDLAASWHETRYIKITDPNQPSDVEQSFNHLWKTGKLTRIRT